MRYRTGRARGALLTNDCHAKLANGLRFLPASTPALPLLTSRWPRHMVLLVASEGEEEEEMLIFDEGWLATGMLI